MGFKGAPMEDKNPIDDLLDQLNDLLKFVEKNTSKPINESKIPEDIEKKLQRLEKDVDAFKKLGDEVVSLSGVSPVEIRKRLDGADTELPPEGVKLIERANMLKDQAQKLEELCQHQQPAIAEPKKLPEDPNYGKHRKKKFKRFGSDEKWKPL